MLCLQKAQLNELVEHSKDGSPNEVCGILAGKILKKDARQVEKIYKMLNTDKSAQSFFMDPKEQLDAMKDIRNLGLEMLGIYHSHPETEAYPSKHDVELAYYPDASYIIVSIKDKNKAVLKSFRIVDEKITEEEVKIG